MRAHQRFGFTSLAIWLAFGVALETLLGFKVAPYLLDPLRRELWTLAHFHGALLALVNLAYASHASEASRALMIGSVLLPLGFFGGGIAHPEGDPSIGVALVPLGAVLVIAAIARRAWISWRSS